MKTDCDKDKPEEYICFSMGPHANVLENGVIKMKTS